MKPEIEPVLLWCKQELVSVWQQIELLEAGKIRLDINRYNGPDYRAA